MRTVLFLSCEESLLDSLFALPPQLDAGSIMISIIMNNTPPPHPSIPFAIPVAIQTAHSTMLELPTKRSRNQQHHPQQTHDAHLRERVPEILRVFSPRRVRPKLVSSQLATPGGFCKNMSPPAAGTVNGAQVRLLRPRHTGAALAVAFSEIQTVLLQHANHGSPVQPSPGECSVFVSHQLL